MHGKGNTGLKFGIALHYGILNMGVSFEKGNSCSVEADSINCKMNENWTGWGLFDSKTDVLTPGACSNDPDGSKAKLYDGQECAYPLDAGDEGYE